MCAVVTCGCMLEMSISAPQKHRCAASLSLSCKLAAHSACKPRVAELDRLGRTPEQNRQVGWRAATRVAITRSILKNRSTDYY
jgi:hypothetical protein